MTTAATSKLTIIAQDPMVKGHNGRILTTQVSVPAEELAPGPWGYRVQVIDYDASTKALYAPSKPGEPPADSFRNASDEKLLRVPALHAQGRKRGRTSLIRADVNTSCVVVSVPSLFPSSRVHVSVPGRC
jgi:hypothetical protein